jgi:hypothetical protein
LLREEFAPLPDLHPLLGVNAVDLAAVKRFFDDASNYIESA